MFGNRTIRTLGDTGFAAWCLAGAAFVLLPLLLNVRAAPDLAAGLVVAVETPLGVRYASDLEALIYQVIFWSCVGGFALWLASLAIERLTGKR